MKKLLVGLAAVAGGLVLMRRRKAMQDERTLWREATTAPDLR